ncbi:MAG: PEPxxWA-CTERM sorting domain-containing protein [Phenylobacterium sp.]|nr:PEPxxWA-CTERM sorting domain-containing protein [Phenylobacterium sp.]
MTSAVTSLALTLAASAVLFGAPQAKAAETFTLVLTSRSDTPADVFATTYGSISDFLASPPAVGGDFSGIDIAPAYQLSGFDIDEAGKTYLLLSTGENAAAGSEVFLATYESYADFIGSPPAVGGAFSGIDIGAGYEVVGFDVYAGEPHLLLATRVDGVSGSEVFLTTFDSLAAFIASPPAVGGSFSGIDIGPGYRVSGFDIFDDRFYLLLSTRENGVSGSEVFLTSYDSIADFIGSPAAVGGAFSGIDIGPGYRVADFAIVGNDPVGGIPEPSAWGLMILGFAGLGSALRRRLREPMIA